MSKLYEALQEAKRDKQPLRNPARSDASSGGEAAVLGLETEMLALYRALDDFFPELNQKVILFLGANGGEGTSTVVSSLARFAAERFKRRVAVLDADTLHPAQQWLFGITPVVGWDDVLREAKPVEKAIYQTTVEGLCVVPVSPAGVGTVQVIGAPRMEGFIELLRERFDLVLIDCAPVKLFPDSISLSRKAAGVVLVIEAESTRLPVAESIHKRITDVGGKIVGTVLNKRRHHIPQLIYENL